MIRELKRMKTERTEETETAVNLPRPEIRGQLSGISCQLSVLASSFPLRAAEDMPEDKSPQGTFALTL